MSVLSVHPALVRRELSSPFLSHSLFEAKDNEDTSDRPRQFESAQLKNLCPETADEAKSLIPRCVLRLSTSV